MSVPSIPSDPSTSLAPPAGPAGPLTIRHWPDDVIDSLGHDPQSDSLETYWLGIIGPPTMSFDAISALVPMGGTAAHPEPTRVQATSLGSPLEYPRVECCLLYTSPSPRD